MFILVYRKKRKTQSTYELIGLRVDETVEEALQRLGLTEIGQTLHGEDEDNSVLLVEARCGSHLYLLEVVEELSSLPKVPGEEQEVMEMASI